MDHKISTSRGPITQWALATLLKNSGLVLTIVLNARLLQYLYFTCNILLLEFRCLVLKKCNRPFCYECLLSFNIKIQYKT